MSLKETKDGILLSILVKPNSPTFKIEQENGEIVVYSTEEPQKGKVNKEIIKQFRKNLGFRVDIVSGRISRQKVLLLKCADKHEADVVLKKLCGNHKN